VFEGGEVKENQLKSDFLRFFYDNPNIILRLLENPHP
jgi:hypothetical protein